MYKLTLLFADIDSGYVDKVAEFINAEYGSRIKLSAFTRIEVLQDYLASLKDEVDILLAHPSFINQISSDHQNVNMIIALNEGKIACETNDFSVNKYQPGDKLVGQLLDMYSSKYCNAAKLMAGNNETKVISVYSPVGGVGKTSVALGLCTKLRSMGNEVLCLSFESINSIVSALNCRGTEALSHIMLNLSENETLLPVKLELYKTRDGLYDFDFLESPDCFLELSELKQEDAEKLLRVLASIGRYDYIVIDMDSTADHRVLSIFSVSDRVIFICGPDAMTMYKTESFLKQMGKVPLAREAGLFDKFMLVMNKSNDVSGNVEQFGLRLCCTIPYISNLWSHHGVSCSFDNSGVFSNSLSLLAEALY